MAIEEIAKENPIMYDLLINGIHEFGEIGKRYCNTSRELVELEIESIIEPSKLYKRFETALSYAWNMVLIAEWARHPAISNYLLRILKEPDSSVDIGEVIKALESQREAQAFDLVKPYLFGESKYAEEGQEASILYYGQFKIHESLRLLKELLNSEHIFDSNRELLRVVICKLELGEDGLIDLYHQEENVSVKMSIIDQYTNFRSKRYAQLLIEALKDKTRYDNGYYPIRHNAYFILKQEELFCNLIEWFGPEVLEVFQTTILEDE